VMVGKSETVYFPVKYLGCRTPVEMCWWSYRGVQCRNGCISRSNGHCMRTIVFNRPELSV